MTPLRGDDHVAGAPDAALTLLEYGDYECPFCGEAYSEVKQLQQSLGAELCFIFRNFPLSTMHPHALMAAEAAECAAAQDAFWPMHDTLYAFDAADGRLLRAGSLPVPVSNAAVAVLGTRAWVVGGEATRK